MGRQACSSTLVSSLKVSLKFRCVSYFLQVYQKRVTSACCSLCVVYFFGRWLWFLPISNPREAVGLHLFIPNSGLNLITGTCFGPWETLKFLSTALLIFLSHPRRGNTESWSCSYCAWNFLVIQFGYQSIVRPFLAQDCTASMWPSKYFSAFLEDPALLTRSLAVLVLRNGSGVGCSNVLFMQSQSLNSVVVWPLALKHASYSSGFHLATCQKNRAGSIHQQLIPMPYACWSRNRVTESLETAA